MFYAMAIASCNTSKRSTYDTQLRTDTTAIKVKSETHNDTYHLHSIRTKDTVIDIAAKRLAASFDKAMLAALFTKEGKPVAQKHIIDTNGLRLILTAMLDGTINVSCEADSYKILVQNLIRENEVLRSVRIAKTDSTAIIKAESTITYKEFIVRSKGWLMRNGIGILVFLAVVYYIGDSVHKKRKAA